MDPLKWSKYMYSRLDGEFMKVVRADNGWVVYVYDPKAPPPTLPGQQPCSQQTMRWWGTYVFTTLAEVNTFVATFLEGIEKG